MTTNFFELFIAIGIWCGQPLPNFIMNSAYTTYKGNINIGYTANKRTNADVQSCRERIFACINWVEIPKPKHNINDCFIKEKF